MPLKPFDFVAPVGLCGGQSAAVSIDTQLMKLHMLLHCWPREGAQGQLSVSAERTCQHRKICSAQYVCTSPHAVLLCASGVTICVTHDTAQSMLTLTPVASELSIQLRKQLALYKSLLTAKSCHHMLCSMLRRQWLPCCKCTLSAAILTGNTVCMADAECILYKLC